jgi:hypothetical protein
MIRRLCIPAVLIACAAASGAEQRKIARLEQMPNHPRQAVAKLTGKDGIPNFNHTAFNYHTMTPVDNGRWKEPDAAAAYAWFLYMTAVKTGQAKYLPPADACMRCLQRCGQNPFHEVLLPYGAVLAARMNAERGRTYDAHKLLTWCFGPSVARPNFGVTTDRWGKLDAAGLTGGLVTGGGYAFAMATDFGLYGSSHVGYLGGIVRTTDVPEILPLDLLKTDWYHARAYPTWLYFNPHAAARTVHLDVGPAGRDLYDTVTNRFVVRRAVGQTPIAIGPDSAALIVVCPPAGKPIHRGGKLLIDGIIVDHHASP